MDYDGIVVVGESRFSIVRKRRARKPFLIFYWDTFWHCPKGVAKKLGDLTSFALRLMIGSLTLVERNNELSTEPTSTESMPLEITCL